MQGENSTPEPQPQPQPENVFMRQGKANVVAAARAIQHRAASAPIMVHPPPPCSSDLYCITGLFTKVERTIQHKCFG